MTGAFIFITLGVLLLLSNLFPGQFGWERTWPVILIVIGVVKIVEHIGRSLPETRRDRGSAGSRPMADGMTRDDRERTRSDG